MRTTIFLFFALARALSGQDPSTTAAPQQPAPPPAQTSPAPSTVPPAAAPGQTAQGVVPSNEQILTGSLELGFLWVPNVHGSIETYRSVVDLNQGPKLLSLDFTLRRPASHPGLRFFDRIDVRASDWGDNPYSTLHVDASKSRMYNFSADYRNIAYYNNLPAYADPLLATNGVILDEQALFTRIRIGSYRLDLFPTHRIVPFLEFDENANYGTGIMNFVSTGNEFPATSLISNSTDDYRAGARVELERLHLLVEQGGFIFKENDQLTMNSPGVNYGNFFGTILGQSLYLTTLYQAIGVRGYGPYTSATLVANPASWVDLSANFLYSQPASNASLQAVAGGNLVLLSQLLFYTGQQDLIVGMSKMPHTAASAGAEIRPFRRFRVMPAWLTDRLHTSGSSLENQTYQTTSGLLPVADLLSSSLVTNFNQAGATLAFDVQPNLTVRGGYRYDWGNSSEVILPVAGLVGLEQGKLRRNVTVAGVAWHPFQNAFVNLDYEQGSSGSNYFRTSLYNYQRGRARGRYRISKELNLTASATILNNSNPQPGINYSFLAHQESASLLWTPYGGKYFDFEGSYTRSTLRSDILYLDPGLLIPETSLYVDNSHTVTALMNVNMSGWVHRKTGLTLGGSAFISSGSNPTGYYQPFARLSVLIAKNVSWISEWHDYVFNQAFYNYQAFRADTVMTGVRITR